MNIKVRKNTLQIQNSWTVSKKDFDTELDKIQKYLPGRSRQSLKMEWAVHNFLYNLGIKREKTGHVDFDYNQKWFEKIGYWILGKISWIFIK